MSRPYLTVAEYSEKYGVPKTTVKSWIRSGKLKARKNLRPMLIEDDQLVPYKDPDIHAWRYQWKERR